MEIRGQLESLAISIISVPYAAILFFVIRPIFQFCMPQVHFNWLPDSSFLDHNPITFDYDAILDVAKYKEGVEERVSCIFCLCDVDEGEEIRELRCRHLFHRSCLDMWFEFGKATCPLCRVPLVPCEAKAKMTEVDGGELGNSHQSSVSNMHNGWWVW